MKDIVQILAIILVLGGILLALVCIVPNVVPEDSVASVLSSVITTVGALIGIFVCGWLAFGRLREEGRHAFSRITEEANKAIEQIQEQAKYDYVSQILEFRLEQLSGFYAPMHLLLTRSKLVYDKLISVLDSIPANAESEPFDKTKFRLLDHIHRIYRDEACEMRRDDATKYPYLFDPRIKPLVEEIVDIGRGMNELIMSGSHLIEKGTLEIYARYLTHYSILCSAKRSIPEGSEHQTNWDFGYFPRELNRIVQDGYNFVLSRIEYYHDASDAELASVLGTDSDEAKEYRQQLQDLSAYYKESRANLLHYERVAQSYADRFDNFDMSKLLQKFRDRVQESFPGATPSILDVGCGTGRDTKWFVENGCIVTAVDVSPGMLRFVHEKLSGLRNSNDAVTRERAADSRVVESRVEELSYRREFHGIWACASLLHVPPFLLGSTLLTLWRSLVPGGSLYVSVRLQVGHKQIDSREFYYHTAEEIKDVAVNELGLPEDNWEMWLSGPGGTTAQGSDASWLNVLLRKEQNVVSCFPP